MPALHILLPMLMAATPADDGPMIGRVVREVCVPFVTTRDFPKALAAAQGQGFAGSISGTHADLRPSGSRHRLQISIEKDEFGETIICKLMLADIVTDAVVASVGKTMGGAPKVVPNLSPQYPPSYQWAGKTAIVSVGSLGGTAPVVVDVIRIE